MNQEFVEALERNPVVAATLDFSDLGEALAPPCEMIFLLSGDIRELKKLVHRMYAAGKKTYVHIDLLEGVANDHSAIQFLKTHFYPNGIIVTKAIVAEHVREEGVSVTQRFSLLDSKSYETMRKTVKNGDADTIETLLGILPEIIYRTSQYSSVPVIAGDLIRTKKSTMDSLAIEAVGVSTNCKTLWNM